MLYEEWKSRYKNLKNFNTVLQRCPRFWPLAPPRGMNPGVYSLGISEDPPRYLSSKFDASVRSDCWDIIIWKTLTQCDGNGNANANANANVDDRGDYNSSPCTSYRRAKKGPLQNERICSTWEQILLFLSRLLFRGDFVYRKAKRKSQKLSSLSKMAKIIPSASFPLNKTNNENPCYDELTFFLSYLPKVLGHLIYLPYLS